MQEFRPASAVEADEKLAAAIGRAHEAAVRELCGRYCWPVHAVAIRATGDAVDADRVTLTTFVGVIEAIDHYESVHGFAPLLLDRLADAVAAEGGPWPDAGDVDVTWEAGRAVASLSETDRDPASPVARQRVEQRVAHLLGDMAMDDVLSARWLWEPPDPALTDRVVRELAGDSTNSNVPSDQDRSKESNAVPVSRQVRPVVLGVLGAVAALFAGIVLLSALSGSPAPVDIADDLVPTGAVADVSGRVEITESDSGLVIELEVGGLPPLPSGTYYEVSLGLDDGRTLSAGSFTEGGDIVLTAGTTLPPVIDLTVAEVDGSGSNDTVVFKFDVRSGAAG